MWTTIKTRVLAVLYPFTMVALGIVVVLLWMRFVPATKPPYDPTPQPVQTAKEQKVVTKYVTKRVMVPGPERIVYLDKNETVNALKMPELLDTPDNVLAAVTIPCEGRNVTAVSTLSPEGEGRVVTRMEPQKFLQVKKEFGARAGIGTSGLLIAEVYLRPLRIGAVNVELRGYVKRDDMNGGDGGGVVMLEYGF